MDGNPIDDILTSTEKALGITFTPGEREQMKAKYKGDAELAFQDMIKSTKKYKNIDFSYKERLDMKSKYKVPLAWVDVMALSENPEMRSDIKNKAGESSAAGYWQVTAVHEPYIKQMFGVSHADFIKNPDIQERYVTERLEPEYNRNLPGFKNIVKKGVEEGRYKDYENLMVKGKFTDDQIKALNHVLGSDGASYFLKTGTFAGSNPERKARDVKRTLGEVINIRQKYGVPSFISDQYDFDDVETTASLPAAEDKVEETPAPKGAMPPGRTVEPIIDWQKGTVTNINPVTKKPEPTKIIKQEKQKGVTKKDIVEVAPGVVQTIDWEKAQTKTEVKDPEKYQEYIEESKAKKQPEAPLPEENSLIYKYFGEEGLGFVSAIKRGLNSGEIADILALGRTPTKEEMRRIAELQKENMQQKPSQAYNDFLNSEGFSESIGIFAQNPFEILTQLATESLVAQLRHGLSRAVAGAGVGAGLGATALGAGALPGAGVGFLAGMSVAGLNLEVSASVLEALQEAGIDVTDPKSLEEGFANEELMTQAREFAYKRGVPIAVFDAISGGIAGKFFAKPARTIAGKVLRGGAEMGTQMGLSAAGETTAQIVSGQELNTTAILAEALGEIGGGLPEIAVGTAIEAKRVGKRTRDLLFGIDLPKKNFEDMVDISEGAGQITQQEADELKAEFDDVQKVKDKVPEDYRSNKVIFDLIEERDRLTQEMGKVDPIFEAEYKQKIEGINQKIQEETIKQKQADRVPTKKEFSDVVYATMPKEWQDMSKEEAWKSFQELTVQDQIKFFNTATGKKEEVAAPSTTAAGITKEQQAELDKVNKRAERIQRTLQEDTEVQEEGDEPLLTAEQKKKLETELQTLNQRRDAIQKQSTAEVPVQPGAEGRQGVGGQVQAEPEVTTREGQEAKAEGEAEVQEQVGDKEFKNFVDKNQVTPARIENISNKVINNETLSPREQQIFTSRTTDINKKIEEIAATKKQAPEAKKAAEPTPTPTTTEKVSQKAAEAPKKVNTVQGFEITRKDGSKLPASDYVKDKKTGKWKRVAADGTTKGVSFAPYVKQLEDALSSPAAAETKKTEPTPTEVPNALKDVESTAKALEGVDENKLPLARDIAANILKEYEASQEEVAKLQKERENLTEKQIDSIIKKSGYKKSEKYPEKYEFSTGASIKRKSKEQIIDDYYDNKIKKVRKDAPKEKVLEMYKKQDRAFSTPKAIAEAYHKAKKDDSNPALVKAVEDLLGVAPSPTAAETQATEAQTATAETVLEPIGKTSAEREKQIEKFFTAAAGKDKAESSQMAKLTNNIWNSVAKFFGARNAQTANQWIQSKVALIGKTTITEAGKLGTPRLQAPGKINWERSPDGKGDPAITTRNPIIEQAAKDLKEGKITNQQRRDIVLKNSPIFPITRFFEPATREDLYRGLEEKKKEKIDIFIEDGTIVGSRLDIPAYIRHNIWVVTVHDGPYVSGHVLSYTNVAKLKNVRFGDINVEKNQDIAKAALNIAAGKGKQTIARMFGEWVNLPGKTMEERGEVAKKLVEEIVGSPDWVQVGMNPVRHSYFYDRSNDIGRPVITAEEVLQVGGLVYAKNPVYGDWTDESFAVRGLLDAAGKQVQFQGDTDNPYTFAEAAEAVANNLITEIDRMIKERSNLANIKKRGFTKSQAAAQVRELKQIKEDLLQAKKDPKWQVDAYHGTPYVFDKFSTEKIGTGEGTQRFGWGLYFTDSKEIAKNFATGLTTTTYGYVSRKSLQNNLRGYHPMIPNFLRDLEKSAPNTKKDALDWLDKNRKGKSERVLAELEELINNIEIPKGDRIIYKVNLFKDKKPGDYTLLQWDKPLSNETIDRILTQLEDENVSPNSISKIESQIKNGVTEIQDIYFDLADILGTDKEASLFLLRAGFDGIKYPSTLNQQKVGFNYVIFDENNVTIKERVQFQQDAAKFRAAVITTAQNKLIVAALESPNASSFVHEGFHMFEGDLTAAEKQTIIDSYNDSFGEKETEFTTDVSEWGARMWEKYFSNGRQLTAAEVKDTKKRKALQDIFDNFTEWLKGVYEGVINYTNTKGVTKEVNIAPEVQALFDNIMGITTTPTPIAAETQVEAEAEPAPTGKAEARPTEEKVEVLGASTLSKKYQRYIARILATPGFSPEYVDALMNNAPMKSPAKDADVRKLANDFVDNLNTLEDYEEGFTELIKQYAARFEAIANNYEEANKGSWEVYAMRLIHSRVVDNFSPQDAINITLKTANIATTLGQGLRMYGLVDPGLLHILHFSKHSLTEKQLFEQEAAEGSGVTVQQTIDNILEIYDSATAEQKEELKKRIAKEIKDQAKKETDKEKGPQPPKAETPPNEEAKNSKKDLIQYFDSKAKEYLKSFENRTGKGLTSGLDIDALIDYAMYLYYASAGSVVKAKRAFEKKFGEKTTQENWDTILESQQFEDATLDIAQQKLIFAIDRSGNPDEYTGVKTQNMTPSQMIIQSLSRYLLNKNKKPATKKDFQDIIKQKDLDINTLSQLRLDILGGLLSETPEKRAEILNQVDDLLVALSKDKLDTIAAPWVKKTVIRQSIKENLDNMFLTVDNMIDDLINRRVLTGAVVEEFIQRTGFTKEQAAPYVKIIQENIDEVINKRVEAKINKAIKDAYGIDIVKMEESIKHLTNTIPQMQKTFEDKRKELDSAIRSGATKDEVTKLQQELKSAKEILANNKERLKGLKAKRKQGATKLEKRAKGLAKAPSFEAIADIIKNGGLSDENIKGIFAESIGAKNFTHKDAETLRALYKRLDESLFAVDKKEAQEAIAKFIYSIKSDNDKQLFIEMFDSYAYSNMLGAFKTTDLALTSGYFTFTFLETISGGIQVGKDITNLFIPGRSKDFKNTRLLIDALFNMRNTQFSFKKFADVILGREGIGLPELSMADDKGKKVVTNINSSITYLDKVRMRRDEAIKKGEKTKAFFLNFMIGHNIASRGLLAADYMVTNTLLPYAVYRNVTAQAMQELKDAGLMSPSYADLRKAIERGMGKDQVEQQLQNEGLSPTIKTKDGKVVKSEKYKKRKAEILFEFVGNGSNQAMIQSEDQMRRIAFTGRIAGFSGKTVQKINQWFNAISEAGATKEQKNLGAMMAASIARLLTSPFAGATFRFMQSVKNATPFGLLQLNKQNKKGIFFSEYNYYNVYTGEVESVPATVFEKEQRVAMALIPTVVAMSVLSSMFDFDDEEDIKIKDDGWLFTTSYSPAMKTKIETGGGTYEPFAIYEKKGNRYERVMAYKDYAPLWFLAGIGRLQEKILFDQEAAKVGEQVEGQPKDPLTTWEAFGESIRSLMAYATQGNLSSGAGVVGGVAEALEGAGGISYPVIKSVQGLVRQMIPFASLQAEADNYYALLGAAKKEGTNKITKTLDDMILFRPLFNNTDFDLLGEDVVKGPYGPPITTVTTAAVQGLGNSMNGSRYSKYPGARDLITRHPDISPIRDFKFGAMSSSDYKGTTVEPPSDPQVNYDLLRAAQTEKATIIEEQYDKLTNLNKLELEKALEKINRDVNSKVKLDYVRSRLLLMYDEDVVNRLKKPKDINDFMVKEGIILRADGYLGIQDYEEAYFRYDEQKPE